MHSDRNTVLGYAPQHEFKFTLAVLKDNSEIDEQCTQLLINVKTYVGHYIATRNLNQTLTIWLEKLNSYLSLCGLRFSKEDHVTLIELFIEFISAEGLETTCLSYSLSILVNLLSKQYLLSPADISIEWRPLYDFYIRSLVKNASNRHGNTYWDLKIKIEQVIRLCKVYFNAGATTEIMEQEQYRLCPFTSLVIEQAMKNLSLFIPTTTMIGQSPSHEVWLSPLMSLWQSCHNCIYEKYLMDLVADYSSNHVSLVDWKPYLGFIYSRILASIELPVVYKGSEVKTYFPKIRMSSAARWCISTLGGGPDGQKHLAHFMHAIDHYYYLLNRGPWTGRLLAFYSHLIYSFAKRIKREKIQKYRWMVLTPNEYKISDPDIEAFFLLLFKPHFLENNLESEAISTLISLRPALSIPRLLKTFYLSCTNICNPWQYITALRNIACAAKVMITSKDYGYEDGIKEVIPLILQIMRSLNLTNAYQTRLSLSAVACFLCQVPIIDTSSFFLDSMSETEQFVNSDTCYFEDIVCTLLDVLFSLINTSAFVTTRPDADSQPSKLSSSDKLMISVVNRMLFEVIPNLSQELFMTCLEKVRNFILKDVKEINVSGKFVACIAKVFCTVNPEVALPFLLPTICKNISLAIAEDESILNNSTRDAVSYYLFLLSEIVDCRSSYIYEYRDCIEPLLNNANLLSFKVGIALTSSLLKHWIRSLCFSAFDSIKCLKTDYDLFNEGSHPINDWGLKRKLDDIRVPYQCPGIKEKEAIEHIVDYFIWPSVIALNDFIDGTKTLHRLELEAHLNMIASLSPLFTKLPHNEEISIYNNIAPQEREKMCFTLGKRIDMKTPNGESISVCLLNLMIKLTNKLLLIDDDDTASLLLIIKIFDHLLNVRDISHKQAQMPFLFLKNTFVREHTWSLPYIRSKLLKINAALNSKFYLILTDVISKSLETLVNLALKSNYSDVSSKARNVLFNIITCCPDAEAIFVSLIESFLQEAAKDTCLFKNLMNLLIDKQAVKGREAVTNSDIWSYIIRLPPPEDPSAIDALQSLISTVNSDDGITSWCPKMAPKCVEISLKLWERSPEPCLPLPDFFHIADGISNENRRINSFKEKYFNLLNFITSRIDDKMHWRHEMLIIIFLKKLSIIEFDFPPAVLQYVLKRLIHDNLYVREEAINCTLVALSQLKDKNKPMLETSIVLNDEHCTQWSLGENNLTNLMQLRIPPDADGFLCHETYIGYASWPKLMKQPIRCYKENDVIIDWFNARNIKKFIKLLRSHSSKSDEIGRCEIKLFKNLFRYARPIIKPLLNEAMKLINSSETSDHYFASAIVVGAATSMKFWPADIQEEFWTDILTIIKLAIDAASSLIIWGYSLNAITEKRDPNTFLRLLNLLTDWSPSDIEFTSVLYRKTHFLCSAILPVPWRLAQYNYALLEKMRPLLDHPYQNMRVGIASLLACIFEPDIQYNGVRTSESPLAGVFFNDVMSQITILYKSKSSLNKEEVEIYKKALLIFKTICEWIIICRKNSFSLWPEVYKIIPLLCQIKFDECDASEDVLLIKNTLGSLAKHMMTQETFEIALGYIFECIEAKCDIKLTSSAIVILLEYIEVFIFYNLPHLHANEAIKSKVNDVVINLLYHKEYVIKKTARTLLTSFLLCKIASVDDFIEKFTLRSQEPLDKKKPRSISYRQGNILGLIAVVRSNPYSIPKYIIGVLETLSLHCNDPQPIPEWIAVAVNKFRKNQPNLELISTAIPSELLQALPTSTLSYFS